MTCKVCNLATAKLLPAYLGVSANVHKGNLVCGGNSHSVHSKHGVTPGSMTRAWPLNPSVPPSIKGLIVDISGLPSSSNSAWTQKQCWAGWTDTCEKQQQASGPCTQDSRPSGHVCNYLQAHRQLLLSKHIGPCVPLATRESTAS